MAHLTKRAFETIVLITKFYKIGKVTLTKDIIHALEFHTNVVIVIHTSY